jgi:hypothetical protein
LVLLLTVGRSPICSSGPAKQRGEYVVSVWGARNHLAGSKYARRR